MRGTASIGPSFVGDTTGGRRALLDVRGAFAVEYGFVRGEDPDKFGNKRTTIGVELFASSVGTGDDHHVMLGLGFSVGAYHHDTLAIAASRPASD